MGCPGQARTKPRRKNQPSQRCRETRRTAAAVANKSRGSSIAAPSATHGRTPRAAHSSTPAAHKARNRCAEQRPATVRSCCPYRATCARDSGTNRPDIAQHFARPAANIPATTLPHLLRNQCAGSGHSRPLCASNAHIMRAHMREAAGGIQLAVGPQPLWLRNHNFGLAQRIMVKRLATSPHDPLGITDSACKNQLVVVSVQYGPFNTYIPIRSTTIGKSRVARDPIAMHTSWRSNSDIASVTSIGYPCMRASGESSTTKHRLLHASGSHPIPPPNDPKTNQYNQVLGLIHSTNGNHLESPNEGSSIDHQVTIHLHAQNITMFPTNETWRYREKSVLNLELIVESFDKRCDSSSNSDLRIIAVRRWASSVFAREFRETSVALARWCEKLPRVVNMSELTAVVSSVQMLLTRERSVQMLLAREISVPAVGALLRRFD
ncbi:Craniofacial development protein 1 isoform 1 [Dorcoceras hygrometricum]|uniref:Craniofacial development protein 1 isoform 1 n=1 Tax=Dorcoceras hygrometricum TaxID=472368 RepID=A0A2Z7ARB6_9LAMI|nr:Craniofacial development protein 1 isoform 1 [Dorcoceras hygrometricum]